MYKYRVQVKKVSGRLNESVLPSKNLVVKSKTKKSNKQVFAEASKYYKKKYGLVIESLSVTGFDNEEAPNVTTSNTQGDVSFTENPNTITFGEYEVKRIKWLSSQFKSHNFYRVMEEILHSVQGKKTKYYAEDNESTGVHDEFTTTADEVKKFDRNDAKEIMSALSDEDSSADARITKDNKLEIYVSKQYPGDWVEYKSTYIISL